MLRDKQRLYRFIEQGRHDDRIGDLYHFNRHREFVIKRFLSQCLDNRKLSIERKDLPSIPVFDTKLIEPTIDVGRKRLHIENILVIEGKPGVGKSHLVNSLVNEYRSNILYRFWISSQDKEYDQRLKYANFLFDFSKKLFNDQVPRREDEILKQLWEKEKTIIIDGLDHVENYNGSELRMYITFIQKLQTRCKTIVLTRPLRHQLEWQKHELVNWNEGQTRKVLDELFHITDYKVCGNIYTITDGYPILVKYLAEHYKKHNSVPDINTLNSVDEYYNAIFENNVRTKSALTLFLCCHSFYTRSEIEFFLGKELAPFVNEFIDGHPYLFERRLNRVSLLHDSLTTYLRKQSISYDQLHMVVNQKVCASILGLEHRFLSRFNFFDLDRRMKKEIVGKYSSISQFKIVVQCVIDFESIQSFYAQVRECVADLSPGDLSIEQYYELSLIINLTSRDHISALDQFLFTYIKSLLFNGYSAEDITSSGYLFAMLYFVQTSNADLLLNLTSDNLYDTSRFFENLQKEVIGEENFFNKHNECLTKTKINKLLSRDTEQGFREGLTFVLENLFIHEKHRPDFPDLANCIKEYVQSEAEEAIIFLKGLVEENGVGSFYASWVLKDARKKILALGYVTEMNDYVNLSLKQFIAKNRELGSFNLWVEILNYIRLALHNNRSIDISSISVFWTKFYQRKDYSLISVPAALKVFEKKKFIGKKDAVGLITSIQGASEKGHRLLLADYVELQPTRVIDFLISNFDIDQLHISWFDLSARYINHLPDMLFHASMMNVLKYHNYNRQIELNEVGNVIRSNRCAEFREILELTRYSIRVPRGSKQINTLTKKRIPITEYEDDSKRYSQSSQQRLNNGVLTSTNKRMIIEKNMKPEEVAGFSNGYYSTLSDISLFRGFDKKEVKRRIKPILHNAMIGKVSSINSFHYLYYFPGNVPQLIDDFGIEVDYQKLFRSFSLFIELSMFEIFPSQKE